MSFFVTKEVAFGLDVSEKNLRLIQLSGIGKKIRIQFYNETKLPPGCISGGDIKQPEIFLQTLNKLIKTKHGRGRLSDQVVAVLPEPRTFLKVLKVNASSIEEIPEQIKLVLPQHVPINVDDFYLDWQIISEADSEKTLLIGAAPQKIVDSYVELLTKANLIPTALEIEAAAISRAVFSSTETDPQLVIDIGANRTGLFLYADGFVKFTISLPISGNQLTQLIADSLELDLDQAEQAKVVCGLDPNKCHGALLEIFNETINELSRNILDAINFYYQHFPDSPPIKRLVLCGGGANFSNIDRIFSSKINLPTVVANPWQNIIDPRVAGLIPPQAQSFITAIGLAQRGLNPDTFL